MTRANVDLAARTYDAFNRRDLGALLTLMDADVEAVPLMAAMEGEYRGHDGIRRWWSNLFDVLPDYTVNVIEVRELGNVTVSRLWVRAHGASSDAQIEQGAWHAAEWRDGKIVWWANYATEAEALAGVALRAEQGPTSPY